MCPFPKHKLFYPDSDLIRAGAPGKASSQYYPPAPLHVAPWGGLFSWMKGKCRSLEQAQNPPLMIRNVLAFRIPPPQPQPGDAGASARTGRSTVGRRGGAASCWKAQGDIHCHIPSAPEPSGFVLLGVYWYQGDPPAFGILVLGKVFPDF